MFYGNQKPPLGVTLDRGHPLAAGLQGRWLLNEGSGNILLDHSWHTRHGNLNNLSRTVDWMLGTGVSGSYYAQLPAITWGLPGQSGATMSAIITAAAQARSVGYITFIARGTGTASRFLLSHEQATNSIAVSVRSASEASPQSLIGAISLVAGRRYHVAATVDLVKAKMRVYVDGRLDKEGDGTFAQNTFANWTPSVPGCIGGVAGANVHFTGIIHDTAIWNRCLTENEIAQLHLDPYGMFDSDVLAGGWVPPGSSCGMNNMQELVGGLSG